MAHELEQLVAQNAGEAGALLLIAEKLMDRYQSIPRSFLPLLQQHLGHSSTENHSILSFYSPGTVFMLFHFAETPVNVLTGSHFDPVAITPAYKVTAVNIEPIK